ncbi:hypothetical protein Tco_1364154, partial [Tanacetum coccineum]
DWNSFKWPFGSLLSSYVLTWLGILVFGKLKCQIRVTSLTVFTLRISAVSSGRCAPMMMLPWLHFSSLRVGTVVAVRTCGCALRSNGVDLLRTPRIRVSGLQGFNSLLELCSWDFLGLLGTSLIIVAVALVPKKGDVADFRTKQGSKELGKLLLVVVAWSWSWLFTWLYEK